MDSDKRKRVLLVVAGACIALWLGDTLLIEPLYAAWGARSAKIERLAEETQRGAGLLERAPALKARWDVMKKRALPNRVSDAETAILESVGRWTDDSQLSVTSVKPRWNPPEKEYETLEIQLEGTGTIDAVVKFLYDVESDPLPLRIEDIEIVSQDDKGRKLNLALRFTGLVFKEEPTS